MRLLVFTIAFVVCIVVPLLVMLIGLIISSNKQLKKMKQKQALIKMMREAEEMGLYDDESFISPKLDDAERVRIEQEFAESRRRAELKKTNNEETDS